MELKDIRERNYCGNSCRGCEFLTYCSDCEKKICSAYDEDYRNDYETGETFCDECVVLKKMWEKSKLEA